MIQIGTIIDDRYEILKEIGRGGMSVVYLAMDNRLNKSLVVKDIRKHGKINNELLLTSLVAEANMLKKLDHGALPKIYDIIESEGDIYVVMDYIEGESLKEKLRREGKMPVDECIDWAKQLSDVLGYLHKRNPPIIYRDMKPDNIMLTPEGKIKLVDFGIAREFKIEHTTDTMNLGTKEYAAPEQFSGKQTDARTDIYSLGATLYHLVTGKSLNDPPYEIRPIREWNLSYPEGLEQILLKCTHSEPANRYQNCDELSYELENIHKLTQGYKQQLRKQLFLFLIPAILFLLFTGTAAFGYKGMKDNQYHDYLILMNAASVALMDGKDTEAVKLLEKAITTVDNERAEAYLDLLDIYVNRNEPDKGLAKLESYIQDGYGDIDQNNQILFKMGMTYFDVKKDYPSAERYFKRVDAEEIPDAKYYDSLALTMANLNIDYKKFTADLNEFKTYNDKLPNDEKKLANYNALANIYLSYKGQIPDANTKAIELADHAMSVLEKMDNQELQDKYELEFEEKWARSLYSRGINDEDKDMARKDFADAIEHYYRQLELNTEHKEEVMVTIGSVYQEMGENAMAVEQFQSVIKAFPKGINAYIKLGNLLLDIEQTKEETSRNYLPAKALFAKAGKVPGALKDEGYKKLTRRFQNLNILEGGG